MKKPIPEISKKPLAKPSEISARSVFRVCLFFLILFAPFIFSSCRFIEKRQIQKLSELYQNSINTRNAQEFLSCFAPDYEDSFFKPEPAQKRINMELSPQVQPHILISNQQINFTENKASLSQEFLLSRYNKGKWIQNRGKEELVLRKYPDGWLIESGSSVYQFLAGRDEEEEKIKEVLQKRIQALKNKDLELFKSLIDPAYDFKGKNFAEVISEMGKNFKDYERIELILDEPKFSFSRDCVEIVEGFQLKAIYQGKPLEFNDIEKLEMRKTDQGWKISKGL